MTGLPDLGRFGQDLTRDFEPAGELGRGGFGVVHRATEKATGRAVALKLLQVENPVALERFLREATVAAALDHPGVVRVHGAGHWAGQPCIVYELVDGRTLDGAWRGLPPRRRAEMVKDAALGVAHAHARGVVHRDLKPANILVDRAGRVRVADFGLARQEGAGRLTRTGMIVGTPHYMAPELLDAGSASASPRTDVWSLGVLLYEALAGVLPFPADSLFELLTAIHRGPTPPRQLLPEIDPGLETICLRALSIEPAARHADAGELARELDEALQGRAPTRASGRRPRRAALAVAGTLLLAAAAGAGWLRGGAAPASAPELAGVTTRSRALPDSPALRWVLPQGKALGARITWTRGVPTESVFRFTYGVRVEEVEPDAAHLSMEVLSSSIQLPLRPGLGREGGREGQPFFCSLDLRTGRVSRLRGVSEQMEAKSDVLVSMLMKDGPIQSSLNRMLHLLPQDGQVRPRWSFPFPLTAQATGPVGMRVCESAPLPGGGLRITSRIEELPPGAEGRFSLEGEAEWRDGLILRARFRERDELLTMGDTLYEWELIP